MDLGNAARTRLVPTHVLLADFRLCILMTGVAIFGLKNRNETRRNLWYTNKKS